MRATIWLLFLFLCCNCTHKQRTSTPHNEQLFYQNERIRIDKINICQAFIDNVEYFRQFKDYTRCHKDSIEMKHPNSQWDPANFFEPFASRYSLAKDNYTNSPLPTQEQITITVDTIIYNTDSLLCFAFICIYSHYDIIKGLENARRIGREYDAKSIVGFRENINDTFKIYPLNTFNVFGYQDCESAINVLKECYFNELKGSRLPLLFKGENRHFEYNLGDPNFFNSVMFEKDDYRKGFYNFQLYRYCGDIYEYQYFSNHPDSIKQKWLNGL